MADVDMSEYRWTPIHNLYHTFDGGRHTISGLTISEDSSLNDIGFMDYISYDDTLMNLIFKDCNIYNGSMYANTGCIAGDCHGTIMNCGVSGTIYSSSDDVGGITGGALGNASIQNSYSVSTVVGKREVGGAIGSCQYSTTLINNCYSASFVFNDNPYSHSQPDNAGCFMGSANDTTHWAFWLQREPSDVGCGNNVEGFYPFMGSDTSWNLLSEMTVEGHNVSSLVDALNAWVDAHNANGEYLRWTTDTGYTNQGFPVFQILQYTLSVQSNDTNMGVVVGGGRYYENTTVTIYAVPNICNDFLQWSDGNAENPRIVTIDKDTLITAVFIRSSIQDTHNVYIPDSFLPYVYNGITITDSGYYSDTLTSVEGCDSIIVLYVRLRDLNIEGLEDADSDIQVLPNPTHGVVEILADGIKSIEVYDAVGRKLLTQNHSLVVDISPYDTGLYVLKITHSRGQTIKMIMKH